MLPVCHAGSLHSCEFSFLQIAVPHQSIAAGMGAASPWSGCVMVTTTVWISPMRSTAVSALRMFVLLIFPFLLVWAVLNVNFYT